MHAAVTSRRVKIMAGLDISKRRLPQDGGIHVPMDKRVIDNEQAGVNQFQVRGEPVPGER